MHIQTIEMHEARYGFGYIDIYAVKYNNETYYVGLENLSVGYKHDFESLFGGVDNYIDRMPKLYNMVEKWAINRKFELIN